MSMIIGPIVDALNWLGGIATTVSGYSTFAVALLTYFLWKENRLLRKAGSEPRVVAHFEIHPDGTGGINMALSNVGTGPAFDVSFSFEADQSDFQKYDIIADYFRDRPAMTLIAQGEKVSFLFAVGFQLFKPKGAKEKDLNPLKPFVVKVNWRASNSKRIHSERYVIDISQYAGLPGMTSKPHLLRIADELSGIRKQLVELTSREMPLPSLIDATNPEQSMRSLIKRCVMPSDAPSLSSEINELETLLSSIPADNLIERVGLESRLSSAKAALAAQLNDPVQGENP